MLPLFNLLIGRQIAVNDGLSSSEADKFGLVSMMIPNVYGLVITSVLAQKEADANAAAAAAAAAAGASATAGAPAGSVTPKAMVAAMPQGAGPGDGQPQPVITGPVVQEHHARHKR